MSEPTDAELSRLLFTVREYLEEYAGLAEAHGLTIRSANVKKTRDDVDKYRAMRGWTPNGFGGE